MVWSFLGVFLLVCYLDFFEGGGDCLGVLVGFVVCFNF